jgi:hypothetical protein
LKHEYSYLDELEYTGSELFRYRLKQIDFDGSFDYSEVVEIDFDVPKDFILFQNYPNPFNPSTTIRYAVPKYSPVKIIVYDLTGQIIKVLVDEVKQPGTYVTTFETDDLSSGVYVYQILADDYFSVKKMNLLK